MNSEMVKEAIRDIPDFPKEGIIFKDITPVLKNPATFRFIVDALLTEIRPLNIDYVVGIESRGFIFSPVIAYQLNVGFIPVRKKGKLPFSTQEVAYDLEYGQAVLQIHQDALPQGAKVAIVDDLLATGGTALAAAHLVEKIGGQVKLMAFLVELGFLHGRDKLSQYKTFSLVHY